MSKFVRWFGTKEGTGLYRLLSKGEMRVGRTDIFWQDSRFMAEQYTDKI